MQNDPDLLAQKGINHLSSMFDLNQADLPWIFVLHGQTGSLVPYPNPLDDPFDTSPQLVCLWARRVVIILELPEIDEAIEAAKKDKDADA